MFKKTEDKEKALMRKKLQEHSQKVQEKHDRKKKRAALLRNSQYVDAKMQMLEEERKQFEAKQKKLIQKSTSNDQNRTELKAFKCKECQTWVDMTNLTCPNCGTLYCQWCGAKMDMMNPGLCPRCKRPPMYTPAQEVVTRVEDLAPEDRFWEALPECPGCGATVQEGWDDCPICGAQLMGKKAKKSTPTPAPSFASSAPGGSNNIAAGDLNPEPAKPMKKKRKEPKAKRKKGI